MRLFQSAAFDCAGRGGGFRSGGLRRKRRAVSIRPTCARPRAKPATISTSMPTAAGSRKTKSRRRFPCGASPARCVKRTSPRCTRFSKTPRKTRPLPTGSNEQKIGAFYASCMDEAKDRSARREAARPGNRRHQQNEERTRSAGDVGPPASHRRAANFQLRRRSGLQKQLHRHRHHRPGRPGTSRSRLLSQGRREVESYSRRLRAHVTNMFKLLGDDADQGCGGSADRDEHRNAARESFARSRCAPRSHRSSITR